MEGVKQIKLSLDARYIFIKPPSLETLETRLRGRGTEKDTEVQKRLTQAEIELEYANVPGAHDKVIVNGDLEKAFEQLDEYVYLNKSAA
jgi:guanylate kinase